MIFVKKTSKLFDKKDNESGNQLDLSKKNIKSEEEKQKAAILKIREALGQDVNAPIEVLKPKSTNSSVLSKTVCNDVAGDDEIWVPKTAEEIKQQAAILKIRELLGEDTSVPIKVSDIKKLEAEKLEAEKKEAVLKVAQSASITKVAEPDNEIWVPKTEEEKLQQTAILKIRELLGEDTKVPIEKRQQSKTLIHNIKDSAPVKLDSGTVVKLDENEQEVSPQYLLIKKLLEEDSATKTETKPAKKEKEKEILQPSSTSVPVSSFGRGGAFTVGAIINAEPTKETVLQQPRGFSWGSGNCFNLEDIINAKPTNAGPENKKEAKMGKDEYKSAPRATTSNSPFFMVNFKDLTKD